MFADSVSLQIVLMDSVLALSWMLSFLHFLCEGALLEDCGAGNNWVTIFLICVKNPDEHPWSEACFVVAQLLGGLGTRVVVLVPLATPLPLCHHAHEDDAVVGVHRTLVFPWA